MHRTVYYTVLRCVVNISMHRWRCGFHERRTSVSRFIFYLKSWEFIYKYINEWYGTGFRLIKKWLTIYQVTNILLTHQEKKKMQVLCNFFIKNIIFELYVTLTNMYYLLCIMQSHKMTKLDMIISDLRPEEHTSLMEKLQKYELGEWNNAIDPIWVSFFNYH